MKNITKKNEFAYLSDKISKFSRKSRMTVNDKVKYTDWSIREDK